jgi:ABC-type uncharacterized transport system involved in gliding motility auxiliary subunit
MKTYRTFGPLGLIILFFGLTAGVLTGDWTSFYVLAHLILGGMMVSLYLFTHIDSLKESVGGRQARYGTNAIVYTVMTIAVIVIVNYLAVQHPVRWDFTEQGVFSLAAQTTQVLDGLDGDVVARAFFRDGEEGSARDLLDSYAAASDRFSYEFIDPDKSPQLAEQYEVTQYGTVHLTIGDESTRLTDVSEQAVTNALIRMTSAGRKLIYYVVGHGELDPEDSQEERGFGQAAGALDNEGYDLEPLVLGSVPDVPADAALVVVAGPNRPYLDREVAALDRYVARGGAMVVMLDPQTETGLEPMLEARGVTLGNDVIIEQFVQLFAGATLGVEPIASDYGVHPITTGFNERTIFRLARSVSLADPAPSGVSAEALVRTSASSWAETDLARLFDTGEVEIDDADTQGPIAIGIAATLSGEALDWSPSAVATARDGTPVQAEVAEDATAPTGLQGRLVVFGDADWVSNRSLSLYFNQDLFLNAVGWLAGEEELISIRPRQTRASQVMLTSAESQAVFYLTVLLLPELILFVGMLIWLRRRNR